MALETWEHMVICVNLLVSMSNEKGEHSIHHYNHLSCQWRPLPIQYTHGLYNHWVNRFLDRIKEEEDSDPGLLTIQLSFIIVMLWLIKIFNLRWWWGWQETIQFSLIIKIMTQQGILTHSHLPQLNSLSSHLKQKYIDSDMNGLHITRVNRWHSIWSSLIS